MKNITSLELLFPLWSNFGSTQNEGREDEMQSSTVSAAGSFRKGSPKAAKVSEGMVKDEMW